MKFLPIILIAVLAFILGVSVKRGFVSPFNATSETSNEASTSAQMSADQANLPQVSNESAPAGTVHTQNGNTYTSQNLPDKVVMSGVYKLSTYNVNFTITLPKNGGDVTGYLSGTCEGKITGKAEKPDSNGNTTMTGQYSGECKPIPTLSFKTHASGTFTGNVQFQAGKAQISVKNEEPFATGGWFEMYF